jgi:hypothetical protein
MSSPELRLIYGEDSPTNRFKSFVTAHSSAEQTDTEIVRLGLFAFVDPSQIVPFDEVEFKVMDTEGADTFYIKLNRTETGATLYEVWCDDSPSMPGFYDESLDSLSDQEAMQLVDKLAEAEHMGKLRQSAEF